MGERVTLVLARPPGGFLLVMPPGPLLVGVDGELLREQAGVLLAPPGSALLEADRLEKGGADLGYARLEARGPRVEARVEPGTLVAPLGESGGHYGAIAPPPGAVGGVLYLDQGRVPSVLPGALRFRTLPPQELGAYGLPLPQGLEYAGALAWPGDGPHPLTLAVPRPPLRAPGAPGAAVAVGGRRLEARGAWEVLRTIVARRMPDRPLPPLFSGARV